MNDYPDTKSAKRESKRRKRRKMKVSGKSVKLLMRLAMERSRSQVPEAVRPLRPKKTGES